MNGITLILVIAATAFSGILAGASLDQSIKQLPARRRIGAAAYSAYAQAADLGNGIAWYAVIGIGAALLTIAAAVTSPGNAATWQVAQLFIAGGMSVLHSLVTTRAAPTMFSVRKAGSDEAELTRIFDRFERWQALRAILQVLVFLILLFVLMGVQKGPSNPG